MTNQPPSKLIKKINYYYVDSNIVEKSDFIHKKIMRSLFLNYMNENLKILSQCPYQSIKNTTI